jgi:ATP-dependent Lon protease
VEAYCSTVAELGLFPLPLVLVPGESVPLHIFEPRYRELIGECIERDDDFGIVLAKENGDIHHAGTRAHVTRVLEVLPDGRLNIVVEGGDRFRLIEVSHDRSFDVGAVEELADEPGETFDPADASRALDLFARLQEAAGATLPPPEPESPQLDWELVLRVDFAPELKQELLELTSPRERMRRLAALLEQTLEAVELEAAVRRRASSNGKVTPFSG